MLGLFVYLCSLIFCVATTSNLAHWLNGAIIGQKDFECVTTRTPRLSWEPSRKLENCTTWSTSGATRASLTGRRPETLSGARAIGARLSATLCHLLKACHLASCIQWITLRQNELSVIFSNQVQNETNLPRNQIEILWTYKMELYIFIFLIIGNRYQLWNKNISTSTIVLIYNRRQKFKLTQESGLLNISSK